MFLNRSVSSSFDGVCSEVLCWRCMLRYAGFLNLQEALVLLMRGVREDNIPFFSLATWLLLKMSWLALAPVRFS